MSPGTLRAQLGCLVGSRVPNIPTHTMCTECSNNPSPWQAEEIAREQTQSQRVPFDAGDPAALSLATRSALQPVDFSPLLFGLPFLEECQDCRNVRGVAEGSRGPNSLLFSHWFLESNPQNRVLHVEHLGTKNPFLEISSPERRGPFAVPLPRTPASELRSCWIFWSLLAWTPGRRRGDGSRHRA